MLAKPLYFVIAAGCISVPLHLKSTPSPAPAHLAVLVEAEIADAPPAITLNFSKQPVRKEYQPDGLDVLRREAMRGPWETIFSSTNAFLEKFVDESVEAGTQYEYRIERHFQIFNSRQTALGYVVSGIRVNPWTDPNHEQGRVILVMEGSLQIPLASEVERFHQDLIGDGWRVLAFEFERGVDPKLPDGQPNPEYRRQIRSLHERIASAYRESPETTKAVVLLGHLPVPYLHMVGPDGHGSRALPTDVIYSALSESNSPDLVWKDEAGPVTWNDPSAQSRHANHPNDGVLESFAGIPEVAVGRIDFHNMEDPGRSEIELTRQYLNKVHHYRHGNVDRLHRAAVVSPWNNPFGSVWSGFAAMFGTGNISALSGLDAPIEETIDWIYAAGFGSPTRISLRPQIVTGQLKEKAGHAFFWALYGSYFLDWEYGQSLLKAPLCGPRALTAFWMPASGPAMRIHPMAMGETIGGSFLRIVRSPKEYLPKPEYMSPYTYSYMSLMGDPTLRLHTVPPPRRPAVLFEKGRKPMLTWERSAADDGSALFEGYYLYNCESREGPYRLISHRKPIQGTSFEPEGETFGPHWMIRAAAIEGTGSGSYLNLSQGVFITVTE